MIDWTKPIEVCSDNAWHSAEVIKVYNDAGFIETFGDPLALVEWRIGGLPFARICGPYDAHLRNAPPKPRELWVLRREPGALHGAYETLSQAEKILSVLQRGGNTPPYEIIHAIEVLPGGRKP
ncbi:MAG: hypothetical protein KAY22_05635 [Rhizorhabdus sp.]|uniref:hypothetical protein n=1 Tax=Rhizorhabdus sp. TaxID=1968843 RepID=UPI001B4B900C|nr:hypothetical protein [Rhizorhabdus sp.]MBP8231767.1 hypothetical protein [Rhizorhabdus sp.]